MRFGLFSFFVLLLFSSMGQNVSSKVDLIGRWNDSNIPFTGESRTYNEVWGFVRNDREYGVIGSRDGTYIIDVTVPEYPNQVMYFPGAAQNVTNRDFHEFDGFLYMVGDQGPSSLQIVDVRNLPDTAILVYDSDTLFERCHNIFIEGASKRLYACSVSRPDTATIDMEIYSLEVPDQPAYLRSIDGPSRFHDVYVRNDTAFGHNEFEGMFVYDLTNLESVSTIGGITDYPEKGYNHSGWLSEDGDFYFFADETKGSDIKVCDVSDLDDIEVINTFNSQVDDSSVAHNLIVKGSFLYISYYHDGLQIFNISNPKEPVKAGFYDTHLSPGTEGFKGAWGVYPFLPSGHVLVSDREKGLFIFDVSAALLPEEGPVTNVFEVYPNPFSSSINVSLFPGQAVREIILYDLQGREILKKALTTAVPQQFTLTDLFGLNAGAYLLEIRGDNVKETRCIVKGF